MAKLLFILKGQNQSPICAYVNWATTCADNNMIYKGKIWIQVRCISLCMSSCMSKAL